MGGGRKPFCGVLTELSRTKKEGFVGGKDEKGEI
jgi:hypothetical protein